MCVCVYYLCVMYLRTCSYLGLYTQPKTTRVFGAFKTLIAPKTKKKVRSLYFEVRSSGVREKRKKESHPSSKHKLNKKKFISSCRCNKSQRQRTIKKYISDVCFCFKATHTGYTHAHQVHGRDTSKEHRTNVCVLPTARSCRRYVGVRKADPTVQMLC